METLRMYFAFTRKAFIRSATYRFDVWTRLFSNMIFLLMWGSIWTALYAGRHESSGVTMTSMLTYIVVSQFLNAVNGAGTPLWEIQEKVRTGDIAFELMKPYNVPIRYFFADIGSIGFYLTTALLPLYILLFLFFDLTLPTDLLTWIVFILSAVLGFFIRYCIELTFGLFTFWLVETGGIEEIFYFSVSLLSGSVIPLWFFPTWLSTIATFLPFQGIYFIPNAIFIGTINGGDVITSLFIQIFWCVISFLLLRFVWIKAAIKVVVQGG